MGDIKRNCDNCGSEYMADERNLKRGWGLCCSKSCAATKREKSKPGYDPERVERNNLRREMWNDGALASGVTTEGYKIKNGIAYDEFDEPVYTYDPNEDNFFSNED